MTVIDSQANYNQRKGKTEGGVGSVSKRRSWFCQKGGVGSCPSDLVTFWGEERLCDKELKFLGVPRTSMF